MAFITINRQNFFHNLNQFSLKSGSKSSVAIVLKDNAYGHGLIEMAQLSQAFGLKEAVVRTHAEAEQVEPYFEQILILGDRARVSQKGLFVLNDLSSIEQAEAGSKVELKVDTGMHRNGIMIEELNRAVERITQRGLLLNGVMTHHRSADELSSEFFWQEKNFAKVKAELKNLGIKGVRFHSYNSAATLRCGGVGQDLIRLGIGAYGYSSLPKIYEVSTLRPVMALWAKKIATRQLKKGERIGYGGDFEAPRDMVVSSYDLGYGDGWMRSSSLDPFITAEGLPILGRVSMDYIILEGEKEEVCIFDDAHQAAKQLGTIAYEIMTQLSPAIERRII